MLLNNLVGKSIERITPDENTIKRLISAAQRNIMDSKISLVSPENRFDAAYKAIMQIANAALQMHGYRTLTSKPGHHQTLIQSGDIVPESAGRDCITQAEKLLSSFNVWLTQNPPKW